MGVPSINPLGNTSTTKIAPPLTSTSKISSNLPSIQSLSNQGKGKTTGKKAGGLFD
jgi:hypothetical protein